MNQRLINAHMEKLKMSNRTTLDPDALRWTPLVHTNMALIDKENESAHGAHNEGKDGTGEKPEDGPQDTSVDILNGSNADKGNGGAIVNGNADQANGNALEDDDEGPIVRPRKRRRSNTLSDSGSEKPDGRSEEDEDGSSRKTGSTKEGSVSEAVAVDKKLNDVEPGTEVVKKRMKLNDEEPKDDGSEDSADNSDSEDSTSSSSSSSSSSSEDSDNEDVMEDNDDNPAEGVRKGSEGGTSESSSEMNNSPARVYGGFGSQASRDPLASLADPDIGMDPAFSRMSPSFECKDNNTSDNLSVDQDMNPVVDFPDTDSTALIKELSEEVFSIGATPSLVGQHSSDDEI